jgi:hypothetical protein
MNRNDILYRKKWAPIPAPLAATGYSTISFRSSLIED